MSVRVGTRYRPERVDRFLTEGPVDHVVIGSGVGGLCCAAALARLGRKVLVLEQHYTAGGFTHSYERKGYEWDVGVHYVGLVGNRKTAPGALLHWVTKGRLQWDALGEGYDQFLIENQRYSLPVGKRAYQRYLEKCFPEEKKAIRRYMRLLCDAEKWLPLFVAPSFFRSGSASSSMLKRGSEWIKTRVPKEYSLVTKDVLDQLTDNQQLKALWAAQWGDAGLPPDQSSFFLHSMIASHYLSGAWYPRGGSSEIARTLTHTIEASGGAVMTYASVSEILTEDNQVVGVKMADDYSIRCGSIISACGWENTKQLLPASAKANLMSNVDESGLNASSSHICLYVGFDEPVSDLNIPAGNLWVHFSNQFSRDAYLFKKDTNNPFPFVYISCSSARDSTWSSRHSGKTVMEMVSVMPYESFSQWSGTSWGKRSDDYLRMKTELQKRLLDVLFEQYPHLKGRVSYCELSTPLSTQYFMRYSKGEIYGLEHTPERYKSNGLGSETAISGLFLAGQDAFISGVVGAAMSGVITASYVVAKGYTQQISKVFSRLTGNSISSGKVRALFGIRT
jgi:phytoene dehydrogenase-like protein